MLYMLKAMNNEILITNYLENNFNVIFKDNKYTTFDVNRNKFLFRDLLIKDLSKIFFLGCEKINTIFDEWFYNKKDTHLRPLNDFINSLKIIDGSFDWISVDVNNNKITPEFIVKKFNDKYNKREIDLVYDKWREDNIYEICKKIFNEY